MPMTEIPTDAADRRELFEMISRKESLSYQISNARRPNTAEPHDDDQYLEKLKMNISSYVDIVIDASKRLKTP